MKTTEKSVFRFGAAMGLLGQFWLREPDLSTLEILSGDEIRPIYESLGGAIPDAIDDSTIESLAVEYCQLLIGPKNHLSPVQSVWASQQFQSEAAASMRRFIELTPDFEPQSNLTDHLGVQLSYAAHLLGQPETKTALEILHRFADAHLRWSAAFLQQVPNHTESKFYRGLANVTQDAIATLDEFTRDA